MKLWIETPALIHTLLNHPHIRYTYEHDEEGRLLKIKGKYKNWELETLSPTRLQITGSLHRWWNGGTNENDFSFRKAHTALRRLCRKLGLVPCLVLVKNLEFGLNLHPSDNASDLLSQVLVFKYTLPSFPYMLSKDCYFMEFQQSDYFVKLYDKGKQFRNRLPGLRNILRVEVKGRNSRFLQRSAGVCTLSDLLHPDCLPTLAAKLLDILEGLVFADDTVRFAPLSPRDRQLYREMSNPRHWQRLKGRTSTASRRKVQRFKKLVEEHGQKKIRSNLLGAAAAKVQELSGGSDRFSYLSIARKPATISHSK